MAKAVKAKPGKAKPGKLTAPSKKKLKAIALTPAQQGPKRTVLKKKVLKKIANGGAAPLPRALTAPLHDISAEVLDRLWSVILSRREADITVSHSARLLSRGTAKVAQKFGEEAIECLIEAVAGNRAALVSESADVLYHLLVMWVDAGIDPTQVWHELQRREGVSGIAEKAGRKTPLAAQFGTAKIP